MLETYFRLDFRSQLIINFHHRLRHIFPMCHRHRVSAYNMPNNSLLNLNSIITSDQKHMFRVPLSMAIKVGLETSSEL